MNQLVSAVIAKASALLLLVGSVMALEGGPAWAAPAGSSWGADYFPNVELVAQDGKKVRFYDDLIKDKVFAINFIYTHCNAVCPAETAALKQISKVLGDRMGKDVFFYTISIDGERDQPEVLKAYADKFRTGPGWLFLTGKKQDVVLLRKKLGVYGGNRSGSEETRLSEHTANLMLGNEAKAMWIKRSPFEDAQVLAQVLGTRLQPKRSPAPDSASYARAPQLPAMSEGEKLFRSRCSNCHSMGTEEGIGPGLAGVVQSRDRTWLAHWLKTPDQLIARKDPLAIAMYAKYKQIPMPNLGLSDGEVNALIAYMENSEKLAMQHPEPPLPGNAQTRSGGNH